MESIVEAQRNIAHKLIEEFMLLANETVASYLEGRGMPSLYRIHEQPDVLKVEQFEEFISGFGYSLAAPPGAVRPRNFQKLLEKLRREAGGAADRVPDAADDAEGAVRAAEPRPLRAGRRLVHALHVADSPLSGPRRPSHRCAKCGRHGARRGARGRACRRICRRWRAIAPRWSGAPTKPSASCVQWKKVRFMADKVGDEFDGYITGVAAFGLFVQLTEHYVEGLVHVSSMADDYYRFLEKSHSLRGENTQKVYQLGERVRVQVVRVDMERRQIDLGLVEILEAVRSDERKRGPRHSKARPKREQREQRRKRAAAGPPRAPEAKGQTRARAFLLVLRFRP